jgi:hypothetical protein
VTIIPLRGVEPDSVEILTNTVVEALVEKGGISGLIHSAAMHNGIPLTSDLEDKVYNRVCAAICEDRIRELAYKISLAEGIMHQMRERANQVRQDAASWVTYIDDQIKKHFGGVK